MARVHGIRITIYDPARHVSRSLTVKEGPLVTVQEVAVYVQDTLAERWRTTKLNDRRHKRR